MATSRQTRGVSEETLGRRSEADIALITSFFCTGLLGDARVVVISDPGVTKAESPAAGGEQNTS